MSEIFEVYVNIPKKYHGLMIGPKGSTVNSLRAEFDVNITIPSKGDTSNSPVVLEGYDKSLLEECKTKMLTMIDEAEAQNSLKKSQYDGIRFKGRISSFSRNYGFIHCPATFATDVFVHGNEVVMEGGGAAELVEGQLVTFSVVTSEKSTDIKAVNVRNHKGDPITRKSATRTSAYGIGEGGQGVIERWNTGFGFIRGADGVSYFCHSQDVRVEGGRGPVTLNVGQKVEFTVTTGDRGMRAVQVTGPQKTLLRRGTKLQQDQRKQSATKQQGDEDDDYEEEDDYEEDEYEEDEYEEDEYE
eukprot:PhF_6_TR26314/c0_g1_i8/m.37815